MKDIYFVHIMDLADYEVDTVLLHCLSLDKAKELAELECENFLPDKVIVRIGKSYFDEEGVLKDDFLNAIKEIRNA